MPRPRRRPIGRCDVRIPPPPVVWLTGLSGAGKTTIAQGICRELEHHGIEFELLDGDLIRSVFPATGFTRDERDTHIRRVALASRLERHGVAVVVALVSPYRDSRAFARSICRNFVEVHVATPLAICEARDVKGLYAQARRGQIRQFTGVDDPYEAPLDPALVLDTTHSAGGRCRPRGDGPDSFARLPPHPGREFKRPLPARLAHVDSLTLTAEHAEHAENPQCVLSGLSGQCDLRNCHESTTSLNCFRVVVFSWPARPLAVLQNGHCSTL